MQTRWKNTLVFRRYYLTDCIGIHPSSCERGLYLQCTNTYPCTEWIYNQINWIFYICTMRFTSWQENLSELLEFQREMAYRNYCWVLNTYLKVTYIAAFICDSSSLTIQPMEIYRYIQYSLICVPLTIEFKSWRLLNLFICIPKTIFS